MIGRAVTILVSDESARVARADQRLVAPLVSAPAVVWTTERPLTGTRSRVSAGAADASGFRFAPKLVPTVAAALRVGGVDVRIVRAGWAGPGDPPVSGGLIRYAAGVEPRAVVPRLIAASRPQQVMVATPNRRKMKNWVEILLRAELGRPVIDGLTYARTTPGGPKVVVASFEHLNWIQGADFDLVVVPDARPLRAVPLAPPGCGRPYRYYPLTRRLHVPAYGFVPAAMPLSPAERLTLGAMFGPIELLGGRPAAVVTVLVERDPTGPRPNLTDAGTDRRGYRRAAIWENGPRTAWVAGLAQAAAAKTPDARVLVLAEAAHAPALADATTWPLVGSDHVGPVPHAAVATVVWADSQRPVPADVLIDARGGDEVDLRGFPPRGAGTVTLVDAGVAGADGERRTSGRLHEYRMRGWDVATPNE